MNRWRIEGRLVLAGHGRDGREVTEGWSLRRVLDLAYYLVVEHMTEEQRAEVDELLTQNEPRRRFDLDSEIAVLGEIVPVKA